jgi:glycosyltransferase involved in cell wall biosynthesis
MNLWVVEFAGKGGLIHYAYQLCRALAEQGVNVTLVTDRHYELEALPHNFRLGKWLKLWDPKPKDDGHRGPLYRKTRRIWRAVRYLGAWLTLYRQARKHRPDAILLGDIRFEIDLAGVLLLRRTGIPLSDICHNIERFSCSGSQAGDFTTNSLNRRLYQNIYRQFQTIFVHNEINRTRLLDIFSLPATRISVMPHGNELLFAELRDPGLNAQAVRASLQLQPEHKVILLVGSLARYKGVDLLIEAFGRISRLQPLARLVIAGPPLAGFDLDAHRQRIESLGLTRRVVIEPRYIPSEAIAAWMEMADIAVYPYRNISQSGALMIAMTFGVPVIVTRTGSLPDYVSEGPAGLIVEPGDQDQLADAILQLLANEPLRSQLGENARKLSLSRFGWDRAAGKIKTSLAPGATAHQSEKELTGNA